MPWYHTKPSPGSSRRSRDRLKLTPPGECRSCTSARSRAIASGPISACVRRIADRSVRHLHAVPSSRQALQPHGLNRRHAEEERGRRSRASLPASRLLRPPAGPQVRAPQTSHSGPPGADERYCAAALTASSKPRLAPANAPRNNPEQQFGTELNEPRAPTSTLAARRAAPREPRPGRRRRAQGEPVRRARRGEPARAATPGPGMTPEQRSRAFDRFWRAGPAGTGTGLALAIVNRLVSRRWDGRAPRRRRRRSRRGAKPAGRCAMNGVRGRAVRRRRPGRQRRCFPRRRSP